MGTRAVRTSEQQHERGRRVLVSRRDVWIIGVSFAIGFWLTACAPLSRLRPFDPEKDFAYGQVEHREPGDAMVVTRATLEGHGDDRHALVIDDTVDDATVVCVVVRARVTTETPREVCAQLARIRQVIVENASAK